ncbi:MAG: methylated-DNA-[protein]-cysteine S-methyltransferase [Campylobacterota bacterium]|nr:methylated-DNA-[protein]-cysteine S-methyltransferase [Campylobacterota bacterium]
MSSMSNTTLSFQEQCYVLLAQIPRGKVTTYQAMAHALGCKAYRAVGRAMATNPNPVVIPCHRVVKSDGRVGGYLGGEARKIALLEEEGIVIKEGKVENFPHVFYDFL